MITLLLVFLIVSVAIAVLCVAVAILPWALGLVAVVALLGIIADSDDARRVVGIFVFVGLPVLITIVSAIRHEPNPDSGAYRFGRWASGRLQKR